MKIIINFKDKSKKVLQIYDIVTPDDVRENIIDRLNNEYEYTSIGVNKKYSIWLNKKNINYVEIL